MLLRPHPASETFSSFCRCTTCLYTAAHRPSCDTPHSTASSQAAAIPGGSSRPLGWLHHGPHTPADMLRGASAQALRKTDTASDYPSLVPSFALTFGTIIVSFHIIISIPTIRELRFAVPMLTLPTPHHGYSILTFPLLFFQVICRFQADPAKCPEAAKAMRQRQHL